MKKELLKEGWKQRVIRLRADYIKLCAYLEFHAEKVGKDRYTFFNDLFRYSIEYIQENGITYDIDEYEPLRKGKGFLISKDVGAEFDEAYKFVSRYYLKKFGKKLLVAEFTELLLYIYSINHLSNSEIQLIDIDFGIEKI